MTDATVGVLGRWMNRARARFARWAVMRQLVGPKVLRAVAAERPEAFFVEIGANDGKMMDPLRATIMRSRWQGLLIEPVPELFATLRDNYRALEDRVQAVNAAIGGRDGPMAFYYLRDAEGQPPLKSWAHGLGSFHKEVVLKHADRIPGIEKYLASISVPCLTWASLCSRHALKRLDVLLIDTEGSENEILAQLDFERWRPALLIYEHHHFDKTALATLDHRLRQSGYTMFREGLDTWCLDGRGESGVSAGLIGRVPRWVAQGRYAMAV